MILRNTEDKRQYNIEKIRYKTCLVLQKCIQSSTKHAMMEYKKTQQYDPI